jgi:hypothetical protein
VSAVNSELRLRSRYEVIVVTGGLVVGSQSTVGEVPQLLQE